MLQRCVLKLLSRPLCVYDAAACQHACEQMVCITVGLCLYECVYGCGCGCASVRVLVYVS